MLAGARRRCRGPLHRFRPGGRWVGRSPRSRRGWPVTMASHVVNVGLRRNASPPGLRFGGLRRTGRFRGAHSTSTRRRAARASLPSSPAILPRSWERRVRLLGARAVGKVVWQLPMMSICFGRSIRGGGPANRRLPRSWSEPTIVVPAAILSDPVWSERAHHGRVGHVNRRETCGRLRTARVLWPGNAQSMHRRPNLLIQKCRQCHGSG